MFNLYRTTTTTEAGELVKWSELEPDLRQLDDNAHKVERVWLDLDGIAGADVLPVAYTAIIDNAGRAIVFDFAGDELGVWPIAELVAGGIIYVELVEDVPANRGEYTPGQAAERMYC
jgi:hypothetical protein